MRRSVIQTTSLALLLATAMAGASAQPTSAGLGRLNVNKSIEVQAESGLQNVVTRYGENRSVPVSADQPNMILTPFADPNVVGDGVGYDLGRNGNVIIVSATKKRPFWISIVDKSNPTATPVSLTLQPRPGMQSQTIVMQVAGKGAVDSDSDGHGSGFVNRMRDVLRDIVQGRNPRGYTVRPLASKMALTNGLTAKPVELYASSSHDIYRFRITNGSSTTQTLTEEFFGDKDVAAVTIYPNLSLQPNQSTDVLIMTKRGGN